MKWINSICYIVAHIFQDAIISLSPPPLYHIYLYFFYRDQLMYRNNAVEIKLETTTAKVVSATIIVSRNVSYILHTDFYI